MWFDYNSSCEKKEVPENSVWAQKWMRALLFIVACAFALSVAYSRIVLGMHSFN